MLPPNATTKAIVALFNVLFVGCFVSMSLRKDTNNPATQTDTSSAHTIIPVADPPTSRTKLIWIFYPGPIETAPGAVKKSIDMWKMWHPEGCKNPGVDSWRLIVLSNKNLRNYTSPESYDTLASLKGKTTPADWVELVKLTILSESGGLWIDATAAPTKHLDDWLWTATGNSSLFYFSARTSTEIGMPIPKPQSWLLYSEPHTYIITEWMKYSYHMWNVAYNSNNIPPMWSHKVLTQRARADPKFYHELLKVSTHYYSNNNALRSIGRQGVGATKFLSKTQGVTKLPFSIGSKHGRQSALDALRIMVEEVTGRGDQCNRGEIARR